MKPRDTMGQSPFQEFMLGVLDESVIHAARLAITARANVDESRALFDMLGIGDPT